MQNIIDFLSISWKDIKIKNADLLKLLGF